MSPADLLALEDVSARAWPALHMARLGGWRLNASTGHTGRANTCWALEAPDRPLDEALVWVESWYAGFGLPTKFKTVDGAPHAGDVEAFLRAGGFSPNTETKVMVGPVGGANDGVLLEDSPGEVFQSVLFETLYRDMADAEERLATLRRIAQPVRFARIEAEGRAVAVGAVAVDGEWAGVSVMRTLPDYRRQGLAARIVSALLGFADERGARRSYLQVEAENDTAVALYETLGFTTAYRYRYWAR
ncbi:MAG: GNAT family N-acetyltransferase [Caulobacter sp.]|nr:GNAT family N-acetyltransferase [Caulobacter sp.]